MRTVDVMHIFVAAVAMLLLVAACTRPDSFEKFVRVDQAPAGLFSFPVDLSDSLSTYDISFYTADYPGRDTTGLELQVVWVGPSGQSASETVYMDVGKGRELYRSGVSMAEPGEWRLDLRVRDVPEGFRGIGIICKRNGPRQTP